MKKILILMMTFLSLTVSYAQNSIKVNVHNVVEAGEQFSVTFVIEGKADAKNMEWMPGDGIDLLWGPQYGHSSSTSIVNGKRTTSSQSTFTYLLRCDQPGKYTIPAAVAQVKGKTISSEPVEIEVVEGSSREPDATEPERRGDGSTSLSSKDLFMRFEVDKRRVVVGEPIHIALKLYLKVDVVGFEGFTLPNFDGFWKKETKAPQNIEFTREKYNDQVWSVSTICEYVLIPQQTGKLTISPAELICLVNVRDDSYGNSQLDFFFNGGYKTVNKKLLTKPLHIQVSPLPQPAPASASGAVGRFNISAHLQSDSLKVNDASSLIVRIKGTGNISLIGEPAVSFPPDFEVYDVKASEKLDASGLRGERIYEYPFIPRSAGDFEIPPIGFSYYDLSKKQYVSASTDTIAIQVQKGNASDAVVAGPDVLKAFSQKEVGTLNLDIRYIARDHRKFSDKGTFFLGTPTFWIILSLMFIVSFLIGFIMDRLAARKADVVQTRTRKATKMAMRRLKDAKKFLDQNIHASFYEELHKALLGFIADRMNVPYGELSGERIAELLSGHGVSTEDADEFVALLDACEFARYAPASGNKDMAAHYESALEIISKLDSNIRKINTRPMKQTLAVFVMLLVPFFSNGMEKTEADSLWNAGNAAYNNGEWQAAIDSYAAIEAASIESPELYYNIGNAYYKLGMVPQSILYYNRSLRLDPSQSDAAYNLDLANGLIKDKIVPVPEFILKTWMRDFCYSIDSDSWTVIFLVLTAVTLAMALLFFLSSSVAGKRTGFFTGLVSLLFAVLSLSMAVWQKSSYNGNESAIVMTPVISVKSSPSADNSTELFLLHEGTQVEILQSEEDWYEIKLADGRRGWLLMRDVDEI